MFRSGCWVLVTVKTKCASIWGNLGSRWESSRWLAVSVAKKRPLWGVQAGGKALNWPCFLLLLSFCGLLYVELSLLALPWPSHPQALGMCVEWVVGFRCSPSAVSSKKVLRIPISGSAGQKPLFSEETYQLLPSGSWKNLLLLSCKTVSVCHLFYFLIVPPTFHWPQQQVATWDDLLDKSCCEVASELLCAWGAGSHARKSTVVIPSVTLLVWKWPAPACRKGGLANSWYPQVPFASGRRPMWNVLLSSIFSKHLRLVENSY